MQTITQSDKETRELGQKIAHSLHGGDIIILKGDLGAGKTTLTKGIAEGFGIAEDITSPTFTLMNLYKVENSPSKIKTLVHIDTYRLKNEQELLDIGVEDYLGQPDIVTIIEWPEKIPTLLQNKKVLTVTIEHNTPNERTISVTS